MTTSNLTVYKSVHLTPLEFPK